MGTHLVVDRTCPPKLALGEGDAARGTEVMLDLLESLSRVEAIEQECAKRGVSPETASAEVVVRTEGGARKEMLTVAGLRARAAPLKEQEKHCEGCTARVHEEAFGCVGHAGYPISRAAEEWLMGLLRPTTELGGIVCAEALRDFAWTGDRIHGLRSATALGVFESSAPVERDLGGGVVVSSDVILEAILALDTLSPVHCAIVLVWFGAVWLDGAQLSGNAKSALRPLMTLPVEARASRTKLVLPAAPPGAAPIEEYLACLYRAWVCGHPLVVMP